MDSSNVDISNTSQPGIGFRSVLSLVLGVFSVLVVFSILGLGFGFVLGIPAVVFGLSDIQEMRHANWHPSHEILAKAGIAFGMIGSFLSVFLSLLFFLIVQLFINNGAGL